MRTLFITALTLAFSVTALADSGTRSADDARELQTLISQKVMQIGKLQTALRQARSDGGTVTVRLGVDAAKFALVGGGTTYLTRLTRDGADPFTQAANWVARMDPQGGVFLGPVPRMAIRDAAYYGIKGFGYATIAAGAIWSTVEAVRATEEGLYLTFDLGQASLLETKIQIASQELATAQADLQAVQQSE